ncbi:acetyltransferase, fucose-4-O-acetylase [Polaromonas sp. CF318]|uniref:acyltransferase family protein n=1 Tax=Polaromonas sp. CF318 TaxID=1144318 RepID=UPI0002712E0C|nr:acyltransferase family protein [Polaromonas sp. CF318]EJL83101.1 acetyltransferase, fucose-4-O-acetylase [Polaromonas sp. CF318]
MNRRNPAIDIARGIGIILVVLGHNWTVLQERGELFQVIYSFHLPLFFFLSGLFLKDSGDLKNFALSRADALLKPYFAVLLLLGLCEMLAPQAVPVAGTTPFAYFAGVLYGTAPTIAWTPLWFLPHLFAASVLAMAVLRATRNLPGRPAALWLAACALLATGVGCIGWFWQTDTGEALDWMGLQRLPGLPWSLDLLFISTPFMLFGFLLGKPVAAMRFKPWVVAAAALAFAALHAYSGETMDLNLRVYGNPVISTLQAGLGIYLVLSVSALLQHHAVFRRPLACIGSASLLILLFHYVVQGRVFLLLSHVSRNEVLVGAASLAAGVALPLVLLELVRRQRYLALLLLPTTPPLKAGPALPQNAPGKSP